MNRPYLSHTGKKPSAASLLIKAAAEKNAAMLREKTVEEHRDIQQKLAAVRPFPPNLSAERDEYDGVPCEWISLREGGLEAVVLYLHGGSWAYGNRRTARAMGALLAEAVRCPILVAEYRLAPEHPYPAGLEDCLAVYRWLLRQEIRPDQIALAGDSAGGNLALCMIHRLREEGLPLPACLALASPVTDLRETSCLLQSGDDLLYTIHRGKATDIFRLYLGGETRRDRPDISPVTGNLADFPPTLIHVGGDEPLAGDNERFARLAWEAGSPVHAKIWDEMFHDFTVVGITLRESRRSIRELAEFILSHWPQG